MGLLAATTLDQYKQTVAALPHNTLLVLLFWADWHEPAKSQLAVLQTASKDYVNAQFITIDVDNNSDIVELYEQYVTSVPTYILIKNNTALQHIDGVNPVQLISAINTHLTKPDTTQSSAVQHAADNNKPIEQRLKSLISAAPVMCFIKGTPEQPRCGFSRTLVQLLKEHNIQFDTFDILSDQTVREELKKFSNWPTYPQVYANGELLGGLDVIKGMIEEGELDDAIPAAARKQNGASDINAQLEKLINRSRVMLFMKGDRHQPQCGFSKRAVALLDAHDSIEYDTFDILSDQTVRENLKKYSNWPTYPQLYVNGKLVGGIDVMLELDAEGELLEALQG